MDSEGRITLLKRLFKKMSGRKNEEKYVDQELLERLIISARSPMGTPKVPLYRSRESKQQAFTVIKGKKN